VLGKNNVDVIQGFARFVDAKTIEVNGETITADHILIATGGRPSHPNIPGVEYGIDSDGFFELPPCRSALRWSARVTSPLSWLA
jgi:glutathione reductase (NADPH)